MKAIIKDIKQSDDLSHFLKKDFIRYKLTLEYKYGVKLIELIRKKELKLEYDLNDVVYFEETSNLNRLIKRLNKIGIKLELSENSPWIYLDKVNGKSVNKKFASEHHYTAFFRNLRFNKISKEKRPKSFNFTDKKKLFKEIRDLIKIN